MAYGGLNTLVALAVLTDLLQQKPRQMRIRLPDTRRRLQPTARARSSKPGSGENSPGPSSSRGRRWILVGVTTVTTKIGRSGPAVRAALTQYAPQECDQFEDEFRQALRSAEQGLDLGPAEAVLDRWWGLAAVRANPLSPTEQDLVTLARSGDDTGWSDGPTAGRSHQ